MYKIDFNQPCHIHFIGIGGISMSGLAEIFLKKASQYPDPTTKNRHLRIICLRMVQPYFTVRKLPIL